MLSALIDVFADVCRRCVKHCGARMVQGVQLSTFLLLMVLFVALAKCALGDSVLLRVRKTTTLDLMLLCMVVGVTGHRYLVVPGLVVVVCNTENDNAIGQSKKLLTVCLPACPCL